MSEQKVKIVMITSCKSQYGTSIFGLGDDQKVYEWDNGQWNLYD